MSSLIFKILLITSILSPYVPLLFIVKNHRVLNKQLSTLFLYLLASIITELIGIVTGKTNVIVSVVFTIIEYSLIAYIFWLELERKKFRLLIYIFSGLFFALTTFSILYFTDPDLIEDISTTSAFVVIITLGILYFYKIFTDLNIPKLTDYYFFWLNSAFLLYFSTVLFLFLFRSYIKTIESPLGLFLWGINLIVNITSNILLTIGICKHRKT